MQNIVEINDPLTIGDLQDALNRAKERGRIRIMTGTDDRGVTFLKFAVGGGMWTLPFYDEA